MGNVTPYDILSMDDPLTQENAEILCDYKEEDEYVDYKSQFKSGSEKDWLEITKDIMAFANTYGGFLVYGVEDQSKKIIGITDEEAKKIADTNNIQQKINRFIEPSITTIRTKMFNVDEQTVAIIYVPQSKDLTHIISKDGEFSHQSGNKKVMLRKGTFYVRHSATNHLGDSVDFEKMIERRIDQFREALMDKVAKVVHSPIASDVYILNEDTTELDIETKQVKITDSPDAIPVKGIGFTTEPKGVDQKVAAWTVLSKGQFNVELPREQIWSWYFQRERNEPQNAHKLSIFKFSLSYGIPCFYWIQGMKAQIIREELLTSIKNRTSNRNVDYMLRVASFLGEPFYKKALLALGEYANKIAPKDEKYPESDLMQTHKKIREIKQVQSNWDEMKSKLNSIAQLGIEKPVITQRLWKSQNLDCYLYAQTDKYI